MKTPRAIDLVQSVSFACECGKRYLVEFTHYQVKRCTCGKYWWALQPHAGGPLEARPWPGRTVIEPQPQSENSEDQWDNATPANSKPQMNAD